MLSKGTKRNLVPEMNKTTDDVKSSFKIVVSPDGDFYF